MHRDSIFDTSVNRLSTELGSLVAQHLRAGTLPPADKLDALLKAETERVRKIPPSILNVNYGVDEFTDAHIYIDRRHEVLCRAACDLRLQLPHLKLFSVLLKIDERCPGLIPSASELGELCKINPKSVANRMYELRKLGYLVTRREHILIENKRKQRQKDANHDWAVWEKTRGKCFYCDVDLNPFDRNGKNGFHVDHVMPKSRGGSDDITNKVPSCRRCNISKRDRTPEEWKGVAK